MSTFLAMGGYAQYVWPSYAATFVVLGAAVLLSLRGHARAAAELRRLEQEAKEDAR